MDSYRPILFREPFEQRERHRIYGASRIRLCQREDGGPGRVYLSKHRQLDLATIADFRLGYVPFSINHPFAGRIVMPIFDCYGRLLALSVRPIWDFQCRSCYKFCLKSQITTMDKACPHCSKVDLEKIEPKYWNESFAKREHLHGMWLAKYAIAKTGTAILCEGQMDVMTLHAHGFASAVGVLGGGFSHFHALLLRRWAKQVVILFDGDKAGRQHADKALELLKVYNQVKGKDGLGFVSVSLPEGGDPDGFVRQYGAIALKDKLVSAMVGMDIPKEFK